MSGYAWLLLYAAPGVVCAVVALRRGGRLDAVFLLFFWPLYAPVAFAPARARVTSDDVGVALALRVADAKTRLATLDAALAEPALDANAAEVRRARYEADGDARMASLAAIRLDAIRSVTEQRDRLARELREADELLAQLRIHDTLGRARGAENGSAPSLDELHARILSLEELTRLP